MESKRLNGIADLVPKCDEMADIGTDHGFLPINLVISGKVKKAYAMDINEGPLNKARANISRVDLSDKIDVILSDGLNELPESVEVVVIAGMGGQLISSILSRSKEKLDNIYMMILSPHRDEEMLRYKLHQLDWMIKDETMIKEQGKYYTIIQTVHGTESYSPIEYIYGKCLIEKKEKIWRGYIKQLLSHYERLLENLYAQDMTEKIKERQLELEGNIKQLRQVIIWVAN